MADVRASLAPAAAAAGLEPVRFRPVERSRWRGLLGDILDRFTRGGRAGPPRTWLWSDLKVAEVPHLRLVEPSESLRVLPLVISGAPRVWFIAEDFSGQKRHGAFWLFETDAEAVVCVLGEHHLFEYYVVDSHLEWMVGENHHNLLFAVGEPAASRLLAVGAARGNGQAAR
jgi:hypothetical protein